MFSDRAGQIDKYVHKCAIQLENQITEKNTAVNKHVSTINFVLSMFLIFPQIKKNDKTKYNLHENTMS